MKYMKLNMKYCNPSKKRGLLHKRFSYTSGCTREDVRGDRVSGIPNFDSQIHKISIRYPWDIKKSSEIPKKSALRILTHTLLISFLHRRDGLPTSSPSSGFRPNFRSSSRGASEHDPVSCIVIICYICIHYISLYHSHPIYIYIVIVIVSPPF